MGGADGSERSSAGAWHRDRHIGTIGTEIRPSAAVDPDPPLYTAAPLRTSGGEHLARGSAALAALLLLLLGGFACGDGGGSATSAPSATTAAPAGAPATGEGAGPGPAGGEGGSGGEPGTSGTGASDGGGSAPEPDRGGAPAATPDAGFAPELRTIIAASLAELAPLAEPSNVYGDPAAYAEMLAGAGDQVDATIGRLEALDPPAGSAPATAALLAAYHDLGIAVDRGADAFASGDAGPINAGRAYLTKAAAKFRAALAAAYESLPGPGFGALGG